MTDLEIDKALALAIGWKPEHVLCHDGCVYVDLAPESPRSAGWRIFSHKDWNVIGPIAERYNAFPSYYSHINGWHAGAVVGNRYAAAEADTPQKAIALAVIGAKK